MSPPSEEFPNSSPSRAEALQAGRQEDDETIQEFDRTHPKLASVLRLLSKAAVSSETASSRPTLLDPSGFEAPQHRDAPVPGRLGRFEVLQRVGAGGFAMVYRAYDPVLHRQVAIKVVHWPDGKHTSRGRLDEARAAARLSHPNLVPLYEVFQEADVVCLVSEYCDGPTLLRWQAEHSGPVDLMLAAGFVQQLCEGLAHSHSRGLVHRDIKPTNIMLTKDESQGNASSWVPRLTDFGLARDIHQADSEHTVTALVGTLQYAAPEQLLSSGESEGVGCDIYSMGVVLYRLLSGQLPHSHDNTAQLVIAVCTQLPRPLRQVRPETPPDLEAICMRCLERDPARRYASAALLADDLRRFRQGREVMARPWSYRERALRLTARYPVTSGLIAAMVLLLVVGILALARANQSLRTQSQLLADAVDEAQSQRLVAQSSHREAVNTAYQADIRQAYSALSKNDPVSARQLIASIEDYAGATVPLGIDFSLVKRLASDRTIELASHTAPIEEIVYLPNQNAFAVAGQQGVLRLHDAVDGHEISEFIFGTEVAIRALAASHDGQLLAVGTATTPENSDDGINAVEFISLGTRTSPEPLRNFVATVETLKFSPDDERLAVGVRYEPVKIFDLRAPQSPLLIPCERRSEDLAFSQDGQQILLTPVKALLSLCDTSTGESLQDFEVGDHLHRFAWSSDDRWIAFNNMHRPVVWLIDRTAPDRPRIQLDHSPEGLQSLAFSPDGNHVYAGLRSGQVMSWDLRELAETDDGSWAVPLQASDTMHGATVNALAISDEGQIASGSELGTLAISTAQAKSVADLSLPGFIDIATTTATMAPGSGDVFVGGADGSVHRYDRSEHTVSALGAATAWPVTHLTVSLDERLLVVGWRDGSTAFFDLQTARGSAEFARPAQVKSGHEAVTAIRLNLQENLAVIGYGNYFLQSYALDEPNGKSKSKSKSKSIRPVGPLHHTPHTIHSFGFLTASDLLMMGDEIRSLDIHTGRNERLARGVHYCLAAYMDRESGWWITGAGDGCLRRHDLKGNLMQTSSRWKPSQDATSGGAAITALAVTPTRSHIIAGSAHGDIGLWTFDELEFVGEIHSGDGRGRITDIALTEDEGLLMFHQSSFDRQDAQPQAEPQSGLRLISP